MQRKIATTLITVGMSVAIVLGIVMAAIQVATDFRTQIKTQEQLVQRLLKVASSGAREALLQDDEQKASELINALFVNDFLVIAQIEDNRGVVIGWGARAPDWTAMDRVSDVFYDAYRDYHINLTDPNGNTQLGRLSVTAHSSTMLHDFYARAASLIASGILRNVILVMVLLYFFHHALTRPLTALVQKLRAVDPRNPKAFDVPRNVKTAQNELTLLAETSNGILTANSDYLQEIAELQSQKDHVADQLQHSERLSAVGQLVGGVAHDFNNILAAIQGTNELLAEGITDERQRALIRISQEATRKGAVLTTQLLSYSRKQPLRPTPIHPPALLDDLVALLKRTLGPPYRIVIDAPREGWHCYADRQKLENVLMNLALNARDALPRGGEIRFTTENVTLSAEDSARMPDLRPGDYVCFSVIDHGIGMTAEIADQAFEPYFTTKAINKGSGLGLSMAYGFAKQSDGHILIETAPGAGCTIRLYLPRASAAVIDSQEDAPPQKQRLRLSGKTLLVVEDEPFVMSIVRRHAENLGIEVLCAEAPERGLALFRENPQIDGALLDVILPGPMNGQDLAEIILKERPDAQIAFMSGYAEDAFLQKVRLDPKRVLLEKPFKLDDLSETLKRILDP